MTKSQCNEELEKMGSPYRVTNCVKYSKNTYKITWFEKGWMGKNTVV